MALERSDVGRASPSKATTSTPPREPRSAPPAPGHAAHVPGPVRLARPPDAGRVDPAASRSSSRASARAERAATTGRPTLLNEVGPRPQGGSSCTPTSSPAVSASGSAWPGRLALDPKLIVADEPVSALDVSIQAQILNLLKELQQRRHLTYIFISHDLAVVKYMADTIGVMYLGKLVEIGPALDVYEQRRPSVHAGADRHDSGAGSGPRTRQRAVPTSEGSCPRPCSPPVGVPLPHPLSVRPGGLRRRGAAPASLRDQAPRRLPLPAADARRAPPRWTRCRGGHPRLSGPAVSAAGDGPPESPAGRRRRS